MIWSEPLCGAYARAFTVTFLHLHLHFALYFLHLHLHFTFCILHFAFCICMCTCICICILHFCMCTCTCILHLTFDICIVHVFVMAGWVCARSTISESRCHSHPRVTRWCFSALCSCAKQQTLLGRNTCQRRWCRREPKQSV